MKESDPLTHFRRVYPECSYKEIRNLVEAIRADKYWLIQPGKKDAFYVVALTRAQIPVQDGYLARVSRLRQVAIEKSAARYCRRGRVVAVSTTDSRFVGKSIILWSAFLALIKLDSSQIYQRLKEDRLPVFINQRLLTRLNSELTALNT